jgi:predicted ATPase/DNA-binding XRE family transcriptional regulator
LDGDTTFGAWLKSRRRQLDLTQKGLAHQVGCSVGTIRKMEADERRPSRQLAGLMAECLEIPIDQHDIFIAFARSEPYISDTPLPVLPNSEDQIPIIPPKKKKQKIKHNLPLDVTQFVGRETELNALDALFKDQEKRLVTILGPGGIGKTRLALDYARHQLDEKDDGAPHPFKDGVFFVDLTPLQETERLVLHLAEALNLRIQVGAQDEQSPKQQLLDYLRDRQLFLLLDNYEHLLPALVSPDSQGSLDGAALVSEILGIASGVSILVTSRVRLNLQMEQVFAIEGLSYPEISVQALEMGDEDVAGYTAIQLFLQAAQRSRQDFSLETADERRALLQICQLVGGMPLGLELAAAWVDVLSLSDIAAEIQQCFDFLETELRDVPPRHRSMRATFDNSWRKLNEREQAIFTQLSVFRGGFTRQAAQVVTDATLRQLSRLANKSFIQFNQPRNRYQVHELLRQYGTERLEQESELLLALLDLHSKYYCQVLADYTECAAGLELCYTVPRFGVY